MLLFSDTLIMRLALPQLQDMLNLQDKDSDVALKLVEGTCEWSLDFTAEKTLNLKHLATPKTFRLIDCRAYCNEHYL